MSLRSVLTTRYPVAANDPFVSLQRALQRSIDDVWNGLPATSLTEAAAMPVRMDVRENEGGFHVTADLPGLTEKEVDVSFDDGVLTLRGEKKVERDEKKDTWHIVERSSGSFARKLSLSAPIDTARIEATFEKGVLTIALPKQAKDQSNARKIEIKTAQQPNEAGGESRRF
jgi:HSP20 family protein